MIYPAKFNSIEEIEKLNDVVCELGLPIKVSAGADVVDARSLLALFTILNKEVNLVAPDHMPVEKFEMALKLIGIK